MEKTNVQHLKEILKDLEGFDSMKVAEAEDFLEAVKDELIEREKRIKILEDELDETKDYETDYGNSDFVGLDTINWSLQNGNLKIQMQMEAFIQSLKIQNAVTAA